MIMLQLTVAQKMEKHPRNNNNGSRFILKLQHVRSSVERVDMLK